jgi:hypothetical protein
VRVLLTAAATGDLAPLPSDVEAWREAVRGLGDPYLRLELEGSP